MTDAANLPSVSVIIPAYNAAAFLPAAIASVQAQSLTDWELLVIDDGSSDATPRLVQAHAAADPRIRLLSTGGNLGAGAARNLGMDAAQGRWLAFLDADDLWHPDKLCLQTGHLARNPATLGYTAYLRQNLTTGSTEGVGVPATVGFRQLLATNVIGCSTVMLDRAALGAMRMPDLRLRQDYAFWLAILQKTGPAQGLPLALTTYRCHAAQASGNKGRAARATWAMYRDHLRLPTARAAICFASYALRGLLRHRAPGLARRLGWLADPILPDTAAAADWLSQSGLTAPFAAKRD